MNDYALLAALRIVRDKLVVAIADVERGDHLRASEALDEANAELERTVAQLRAAA